MSVGKVRIIIILIDLKGLWMKDEIKFNNKLAAIWQIIFLHHNK